MCAALIQRTGVPIKRGHMRTQRKGGRLQAQEEGLRRTQSFPQIDLGLQPPKLKNTIGCLGRLYLLLQP